MKHSRKSMNAKPERINGKGSKPTAKIEVNPVAHQDEEYEAQQLRWNGEVSLQASELDGPPMQSVQRMNQLAFIGQVQGNAHVQRLMVQMQPTRRRPAGANPGGRGPGRIANATENPYTVTGATLADITGQLHPFGGFGAQTSAPLGMSGRVKPTKLPDGSFQARITWAINGATVGLPRWGDYDNACPAAQAEWDRFMTQTRAHEQAEHVNAARNFVAGLTDADTVITGATMSDIQTNLEAKQQDLGTRLQAIHDACDHGVAIDAILHPDAGQCD